MRAPVLLVLFATAAAAEQPLATYPGAVSTRIGNELTIGGELYRIAYFLTDDPPSKVAAHFKKAWDDEGYPVSTYGDFVDEGVVSAFFTRQGLVRSIVLRRHDGRTLGFSVLKDAWSKSKAGGADPLPKLEGALLSSDLVARGEEASTQHRSAVLPLSMPQARDGRDAAWLAAGWARSRETRVASGRGGRNQRVLEYLRGREQAVVTLVEIDAKTTAMDETWISSGGVQVEGRAK